MTIESTVQQTRKINVRIAMTPTLCLKVEFAHVVQDILIKTPVHHPWFELSVTQIVAHVQVHCKMLELDVMIVTQVQYLGLVNVTLNTTM